VAALGPAAFAALVWGGVIGVVFVFLYQVYVLVGDARGR
jgi:hypothetical protein